MSDAPPLTFKAQWVVPIAREPIRNGVVTIGRDGRIRSVDSSIPEPGRAVDLGNVVLLPALVNAHTHLELSYLRGSVPPTGSFSEWVSELMSRRRAWPDPAAPAILDAARQAIDEAHHAGTGVIGDISNTLVTVDLLRDARMAAHVFYEQLGFNIPDAVTKVAQARDAIAKRMTDDDRVRISLAPHAPYSVSPGLFRAIRADVDAGAHPLTSVHLGESPQEVQLLRDGTGATRVMLERLGVWTDEWKPPGVSPVTYLADLGFLDARTLVVHGVQFDSADLARLRAIGATLVSCPRSNAYVGVGSPPLQSFYDAGVTVAFGTDSLASVADLNMFNELAEARRTAPGVSARRLLESATLMGARALGFASDLGSLDVGKRAVFSVVRMPRRTVRDVEEFLVSGVDSDAIRPFDPSARVNSAVVDRPQ
jgi:cytosine/adenosine deaminase-related metal-dependent hydrolase